ncbi:MAG: PASTA domain-containing protein [Planctomycetota bacterium]|nr:PASTA domain-containing protein [Planctomycetota bacterium]
MTRLCLSALCAFALAAAFALPAYAGEETVPDVCGMQADAAKSLLEQAGFTVRMEYAQGKKIGFVFSQSPGGFSTLDTSKPVTLRVGGPTPKPSVDTPKPPSDDLPPAGAGTMPIEPGADAPTQPAPTQPAPTEPAPSQPAPAQPTTPAAGALVWNGKAIPEGFLPEGNGPEVPSVLGQTVAQARQALRGWNVRVEQTLAVPQLVGKIVNQWPPAGSNVAAGDTLTIVTAVAERPSVQHRYVPQVEGRDWFDSIQNIEKGGFVPEPVSVASSAANRGRVVAQSPQPGTLELGGQIVRIFVGRGPGAYSADAPTQPAPMQPSPTQPAPAQPSDDLPPAGAGTMPIEPGADEPRPARPPVEPAPTQPAPTQPAPTPPQPVEPKPEPKPMLGAPSLSEPPAGESYPFKYGADFRWTAVGGAASYELELQEELPSGAWQTKSTTTVTGPRHRPAKIERGRYRWRVRGVTSEGEKGRWSEYRRLYMY